VPARAAGICGLLSFVTVNLGWILGGLAQPDAFSTADDDIRRIPEWRDSWIVSLATVPAIIVANVVFGTQGDGAATRAGTVVVFVWFAFLGFRLVQKGEPSREAAAPPVL
jgi:hypothetical protein